MNLSTIAAFLVLAFAPSFVDWKDADQKTRNEIVGYYAIVLGLVYLGLPRNA